MEGQAKMTSVATERECIVCGGPLTPDGKCKSPQETLCTMTDEGPVASAACRHDPAQFVTAAEGTSYCPACEAAARSVARKLHHVKGERRVAVQEVHDAAGKVLGAMNHAEAYMAFSELARAVNELDAVIERTVKR